MEYVFDGSIANNLKDNPNISVTVFKKKEEGWDKVLDPFYSPETKGIPRLTSHNKTITLSIALNEMTGENKICKIAKMENGTAKGPNKVSNYKWEVEITSNKEKVADPSATINLEVCYKE